MVAGRMRLIGGLCVALAACGSSTTQQTKQGVLPGVESVVFVKRAYLLPDGQHEVTGGVGQVFDYDRYVPGQGAGLFVLSPPAPDGKLTELTAGLQGVDINGVDLSFDAKKVAFSMRFAGEDRYHIFVANVSGPPTVKQLTFGEADDTQPVFLAGGRIAFVTNQMYTEMGTRADEYNHGRRVTQMATISEIAGDADRRLCSQNLSHSAAPFALSNGLVGFSRWEHLGPVNDVKLFTMRPDCTQMRAIAGQHDKPFNSLVQVRELSPGELLGVATTREGTIQAGALYRVSVPVATDTGVPTFDEQHAVFNKITTMVPTGMEPSLTGVGRYRSPALIKGASKWIVSWADGDVNERNELAATAPNFGLYLYDPASDSRQLVYDDPLLWDLYATPVVARDEPPVIPSNGDGMYNTALPGTIGSFDIKNTSLTETVSGAQFNNTPLNTALADAQRVRVIEGFSSEIGGVGQFGLTMHEGGAILGEAPVYADGSWLAEIPPYLPVHLQPIDRFDLSIRNQLLWIQTMPGESRVCGGCHESRVGEVTGSTTTAQLRGPAKLVKPIAERSEFPWFAAAAGSNVQDVLDAKCVSCHAGGAGDPFAGQTYTVVVMRENATESENFVIPVLDLSSKPISAYYEREAISYPASYVSLLYPSAMMGRDVVRIQGVPIEWVVPGNARASRFIAKLNVNAVTLNSDGSLSETTNWAFPTPAHPEDKGVTLTRDQRLTLIRSIDLGGQYFSRRNAPGGAFTGVDYQNP
jgi:Hydrazine synthase alpha subunit middle domain